MADTKYKWFASGNAPLLYPTEIKDGIFLAEDFSNVRIPDSYPFATDWGKVVSTHLLPDNFHSAPKFIVIAWLSIVENKFYAVADELPAEKIAALLAEKDETTKKPKYDTIVAGMAPCGKLAVWLAGNRITTEVAWLQGKEVDFDMKDFAPASNLSSRKEYAQKALSGCPTAYANFQQNGLPKPQLFEQYMQKFNYCFAPKFDNPDTVLDGIEIYCYNGELNALNSDEYLSVASRAKPRKIVLKWRIGKIQYEGYFWLDEQKIIETFTDFYEIKAQKEGNLNIQTDVSNRQFAFCLKNGDTLVDIPTQDMQYIVFKNKFELHRSANYNRPKGGWRN
jgi:hypothetical protein